MSAFSQSTFNAVKYSAARPRYPPALYNYLLSLVPNAQPQSSVLLDLGAGPGHSTFPLVPKFARTIALDPSENMIQQGRKLASEKGLSDRVEFTRGSAEDLAMLESQSVDLAIAAQAAHWFDAPKVYTALERVLKPGGTVAFSGYGEIFFPHHPKSTKLLSHFSSKKVGKYWQQPGRGIVEDLLRPVPLPKSSAWDKDSLRRTFFDLGKGSSSSTAGPALSIGKEGEKVEHRPVILKHEWTLEQLAGYLSTWSSVHLYDAEHGGDVASEFVEELSSSLRDEGMGEKVECAWQLCVMSARLREKRID